MKPDVVDRLNGAGLIWRVLGPLMWGVLLSLMFFNLNGIREDIVDLRSERQYFSNRMMEYTNEMRSYFTNHLQEHKAIEMALEKRLSCLEVNQQELLRLMRNAR